jgi:hypothetical protein
VKFLHLPWIYPYIGPHETDQKGPGALVGVSSTPLL